MRKFHPVRFRCHDCEMLMFVDLPLKKMCTGCGREYDFSFLKPHEPRPIVHRDPNAPPRQRHIPDPPIGALQDEIRIVQIKNRHLPMVKRRARVVVILRDEKHYTYSEIARTIERNHATVINLYRRARILMIETNKI